MKDFLEFTTKEIKELGLSPLYGRDKINSIIQTNCVANVIGSKIYVTMHRGGEYIESPDFIVKKTAFLDMDTDFFNKIGISGYTLEKYLWLQKYIKGEVSGEFDTENAKIEVAIHNACNMKDKEIEYLRRKVDNLMLEKENIKEENRELKRTIKSNEKFYDKMKLLQEQLLKIEL